MTEPEKVPTDLLPFATRYVFAANGKTITIERYTNHGRLTADGGWMVGRWLSPLGSDVTNVLYLGEGDEWRYKSGYVYPSLEKAYAAFQRAGVPDA